MHGSQTVAPSSIENIDGYDKQLLLDILIWKLETTRSGNGPYTPIHHSNLSMYNAVYVYLPRAGMWRNCLKGRLF